MTIRKVKKPAYQTDSNNSGGIKIIPAKANFLLINVESLLKNWRTEIIKYEDTKQKDIFGCPDMLLKKTYDVEIRITKPNCCVYVANNFLDRIASPNIDTVRTNMFESLQESTGSFPTNRKKLCTIPLTKKVSDNPKDLSYG